MLPSRWAGGVAPGYHIGLSAARTTTFRAGALGRAKLDARGRPRRDEEMADITKRSVGEQDLKAKNCRSRRSVDAPFETRSVRAPALYDDSHLQKHNIKTFKESSHHSNSTYSANRRLGRFNRLALRGMSVRSPFCVCIALQTGQMYDSYPGVRLHVAWRKARDAREIFGARLEK